MLKIPNYPPLLIIGIDPGTQHLGCAFLHLDSMSNEIVSLSAITYTAKQLAEYDKNIALVHSDTTARIFAYRQFLTNLFTEHKPTLIGSESPFFFRLHPGAYGPLVETLAAIREAVWNYDNTLSLTTIPPSNVKKAVHAKGNATKEDMTKALLAYPDLPCDKEVLANYDEHSVDACAVALATYRIYVKKDLKCGN